MIYTKKKIKPYYLLVLVLSLVLFSCSTTRQLEKKQSKEVYESLGLQKDRKDNFALYREAASWLHVPHWEGGLSRTGIDCSGLVYLIYKKVYSKNLERNSLEILKKNCRKRGKNGLREGDLVFFNSGSGSKTKRNINHVGIYLKDHKFLHASTSQGVIVSNLDEKYYLKTWVCSGRIKK